MRAIVIVLLKKSYMSTPTIISREIVQT